MSKSSDLIFSFSLCSLDLYNSPFRDTKLGGFEVNDDFPSDSEVNVEEGETPQGRRSAKKPQYEYESPPRSPSPLLRQGSESFQSSSKGKASATPRQKGADEEDEEDGGGGARGSRKEDGFPIFTFVEVDRTNWPRAIRGQMVNNNVMGMLEIFRSGPHVVHQRMADGVVNASQMISCLNITQYHANKILTVLQKYTQGAHTDLRDKKDRVVNGLWSATTFFFFFCCVHDLPNHLFVFVFVFWQG